jgi:hypothetical protein
MKTSTSVRSALPITAAITLAGASFSGAAGDERLPLPKEPQGAISSLSSVHPASVLTTLLSFLEALNKYHEFMPEGPVRLAVFTELQRDGTLAAVPLSPLEQKALLLTAENGTESVITGLLKAHADVRNGGIEETAIFRRIPSTTHSKVTALQSEHSDEYQKGLRLLYVLAGLSELHNSQQTDKDPLRYVTEASPSRATVLATLVGALRMSARLSPEALSAPLTRQFIEKAQRSVTLEDVHSIPQLGSIKPVEENRIAVAALTISLTGLAMMLYNRIRAQEKGSLRTDEPSNSRDM